MTTVILYLSFQHPIPDYYSVTVSLFPTPHTWLLQWYSTSLSRHPIPDYYSVTIYLFPGTPYLITTVLLYLSFQAPHNWLLQCYCISLSRHPIPDYYSVTVEIARDRITTASEIQCDSHNPHQMACPNQYSDGDTYLHRTINEACQQMVGVHLPMVLAVIFNQQLRWELSVMK